MTEGKLKDRDRKQEFQESSVMMVKFVMYFMIIIIILIYLYFGLISRTGLSEREPFCFIDSWTVYDGEGDSFSVGRNYIADKDYKDGTVESDYRKAFLKAYGYRAGSVQQRNAGSAAVQGEEIRSHPAGSYDACAGRYRDPAYDKSR